MLETVRRILNAELYRVGDRAAAAQVAGDRRALAVLDGAERKLTAALREVQRAEAQIEARREALALDYCEAVGRAVVEILPDPDGGLVWIHGSACQNAFDDPACSCDPRVVYVMPPDRTQTARA